MKMNEGSARVSGTKKAEDAKQDEKTKIHLLGVVIAVVVLAVLLSLAIVSIRLAHHVADKRLAWHSETPKAAPAQTARYPIVRYLTLTSSGYDDSQEITIHPELGENVVVAPIDPTVTKVYVRVDGGSERPQTVMGKADPDENNVSAASHLNYRAYATRDVGKKFGYCIFQGSTPPADWYQKILQGAR